MNDITTIEVAPTSDTTPTTHTHNNWREFRKRNLILTCLPKGRYQNVLELACSTGMLSSKLAERTHQLTCCDSSENALNAAMRRLGNRPHVRFMQRQVPKEWPEGQYDLIVINDLARVLTPVELVDTTIKIRDSLSANCSVLACHWRSGGASETEYQTAEQVHDVLNEHLGTRTLHHEEQDILLDIWQGTA